MPVHELVDSPGQAFFHRVFPVAYNHVQAIRFFEVFVQAGPIQWTGVDPAERNTLIFRYDISEVLWDFVYVIVNKRLCIFDIVRIGPVRNNFAAITEPLGTVVEDEAGLAPDRDVRGGSRWLEDQARKQRLVVRFELNGDEPLAVQSVVIKRCHVGVVRAVSGRP